MRGLSMLLLCSSVSLYHVCGENTVTSNSRGSAVLSGDMNKVTQANYATVVGGAGNQVVSNFATVLGGYANLARGRFSSVLGGSQNTAAGRKSVAMGSVAKAMGDFSLAMGFQETSEGYTKCQVGPTDSNTVKMCAKKIDFTDAEIMSHGVPLVDYIAYEAQAAHTQFISDKDLIYAMNRIGKNMIFDCKEGYSGTLCSETFDCYDFKDSKTVDKCLECTGPAVAECSLARCKQGFFDFDSITGECSGCYDFEDEPSVSVCNVCTGSSLRECVDATCAENFADFDSYTGKCQPVSTWTQLPDDPSNLDGGGWNKFWWYTPNTPFPMDKRDVFGQASGTCSETDTTCFQKLPMWLPEVMTELMAVDSAGHAYKWKFDPKNNVAHAIFQAMKIGKPINALSNGNAWNPTVIKGNSHPTKQDSFMFRWQDGIRSFLLDDDKCDCQSTLSMGHAMCGSGCSSKYGDCNIPGGVDILRDNGCRGPNHLNGLMLYYRVQQIQGGGWTPFWWYAQDTPWPAGYYDVFQERRRCHDFEPTCMSKLPKNIPEDVNTELLAIDSKGTVFKWRFDKNHAVAHATFEAMRDGKLATVKNYAKHWYHQPIKGNIHSVKQDTVMYRDQKGTLSFLMDDDTCDCKSTISMGRAMCGSGKDQCSDKYAGGSGKCNQPGGVDYLEDNGCVGPTTTNGLTLFYRRPESNLQGKVMCRQCWYVHATAGDDSKGTGTQTNPFKTITAAESKAPAWIDGLVLIGTFDIPVGHVFKKDWSYNGVGKGTLLKYSGGNKALTADNVNFVRLTIDMQRKNDAGRTFTASHLGLFNVLIMNHYSSDGGRELVYTHTLTGSSTLKCMVFVHNSMFYNCEYNHVAYAKTCETVDGTVAAQYTSRFNLAKEAAIPKVEVDIQTYRIKSGGDNDLHGLYAGAFAW